MVDFKKLNENRWNSLTEEEKEQELKVKQQKIDSVIYRSDVPIDAKFNIEDCTLIIRKGEEDKYLLEIVDKLFRDTGDRVFWGYYLDKHFRDKIMKQTDDTMFVLDMGSSIRLNVTYMKDVIRATENKINWEDDYFPEVTKMLKGTKFE